MSNTNKYVSSNNIDVFPCIKRQARFAKNRLLTENNLVNIINRLTDRKSFVVTTNTENKTGLFLFNINGYLITTSISVIEDLFTFNALSVNNYIIATLDVNIDTLDTGTQDSDTDADDFTESSIFQGVEFTLSEVLPTDSLSLAILQVTEISPSVLFSIPPESTIKFETNSTIRSLKIDDGVI